MRRRGFLATMMLTVVLASVSWAQSPVAQNSDAKVLAAFKAKVDAYDALRKDLAKKTPSLKKADDAQQIARG